jgi:thiol-disulfide isomerase/thioredoxin
MSETVKTINIEEFKLNDKYNFVSCTAEWCNPCKRIKPHVLSFVKNKEKVSELKIDQKKYQVEYNKYVPYFIILDTSDDLKKIDAIQTSNNEEFSSFIIKYMYMPVLDENF